MNCCKFLTELSNVPHLFSLCRFFEHALQSTKLTKNLLSAENVATTGRSLNPQSSERMIHVIFLLKYEENGNNNISIKNCPSSLSMASFPSSSCPQSDDAMQNVEACLSDLFAPLTTDDNTSAGQQHPVIFQSIHLVGENKSMMKDDDVMATTDFNARIDEILKTVMMMMKSQSQKIIKTDGEKKHEEQSEEAQDEKVVAKEVEKSLLRLQLQFIWAPPYWQKNEAEKGKKEAEEKMQEKALENFLAMVFRWRSSKNEPQNNCGNEQQVGSNTIINIRVLTTGISGAAPLPTPLFSFLRKHFLLTQRYGSYITGYQTLPLIWPEVEGLDVCVFSDLESTVRVRCFKPIQQVVDDNDGGKSKNEKEWKKMEKQQVHADDLEEEQKILNNSSLHPRLITNFYYLQKWTERYTLKAELAHWVGMVCHALEILGGGRKMTKIDPSIPVGNEKGGVPSCFSVYTRSLLTSDDDAGWRERMSFVSGWGDNDQCPLPMSSWSSVVVANSDQFTPQQDIVQTIRQLFLPPNACGIPVQQPLSIRVAMQLFVWIFSNNKMKKDEEGEFESTSKKQKEDQKSGKSEKEVEEDNFCQFLLLMSTLQDFHPVGLLQDEPAVLNQLHQGCVRSKKLRGDIRNLLLPPSFEHEKIESAEKKIEDPKKEELPRWYQDEQTRAKLLDSLVLLLSSSYLSDLGLARLAGVRLTTGSTTAISRGCTPPSLSELTQSFLSPHDPNNGQVFSVGARALAKHIHRDQTVSWWGPVSGISGSQSHKNHYALCLMWKIIRFAKWVNVHMLPHDIVAFEVRNREGYGLRWMVHPDHTPSSDPKFHDGDCDQVTATTTSSSQKKAQEKEEVSNNSNHDVLTGVSDLFQKRTIEFRGFLEPQDPEGHAKGWQH